MGDVEGDRHQNLVKKPLAKPIDMGYTCIYNMQEDYFDSNDYKMG
jgi:hypothetical protein